MVQFPYPPPSTALARLSALAPASPLIDKDVLVFTKLSSINFLQLTLKNVQTGAGEGIDKVKSDGTLKEIKGKGKVAWTAALTRYEKEVAWMKKPQVKEVRLDMPHLVSLHYFHFTRLMYRSESGKLEDRQRKN